MAPASGDCANSWPSIVVNRALSASMSGAALARTDCDPCFRPRQAAESRAELRTPPAAFDHLVERTANCVPYCTYPATNLRLACARPQKPVDRAAMTARQRLVWRHNSRPLQNAGEAGQLAPRLSPSGAAGRREHVAPPAADRGPAPRPINPSHCAQNWQVRVRWGRPGSTPASRLNKHRRTAAGEAWIVRSCKL